MNYRCEQDLKNNNKLIRTVLQELHTSPQNCTIGTVSILMQHITTVQNFFDSCIKYCVGQYHLNTELNDDQYAKLDGYKMGLFHGNLKVIGYILKKRDDIGLETMYALMLEIYNNCYKITRNFRIHNKRKIINYVNELLQDATIRVRNFKRQKRTSDERSSKE